MKVQIRSRPETTGQLIIAVPLSLKKAFVELRRRALRAGIDFNATMTQLLTEFADELVKELKQREAQGNTENHAEERV